LASLPIDYNRRGLSTPQAEERLRLTVPINSSAINKEDLILAIAKLEIQVSIQADLINTLIQNPNMLFLDVESPSIEQDAVQKNNIMHSCMEGQSERVDLLSKSVFIGPY
jgi:hypothetical protein